MAAKTVSSGVLIVVLFALVLFVILPTLQTPTVSLELSQSKVKKGSDVTLFITATNNSNEEITQILLDVDSNSNLVISPTEYNVRYIKPKEMARYSSEIRTTNVTQGLYEIRVKMEYYVPTKNLRYTLTKTINLEVFE